MKEAINQKVDVAILDDGLQDRLLQYDISFVCFNIQNWIGNGLCLPAGPLREGIKNLKKYDAVFLNGNGEESDKIENIIKNIKPNIKIFKAEYNALNIKEINLNGDYLVFSGIGNPSSFLETLKKNNIRIIKSLSFPDHYDYSDKDILEIKKKAEKLNAKIITTEKDFNRLNSTNSEGIEFLKIELKILNEESLINFLDNKL